MDFKLFHCSHCGNIVYKAHDSGAVITCCNSPMEALQAGVTDAAQEKHVPVVEKQGDAVTVTVGSVIHPMEEKHYIPLIIATNEDTVVIKKPNPGDAPVLKTSLEGDVTAYEWCNLHGLWMGK